VSVSGFGWSGSSACISILKEFESISFFEGEFRIARDPYGLTNLQNAIVNNWDYVSHDTAIKKFLEYCEMLSRETGFFSPVGKGFSNKLGADFLSLSKDYIDSLVSMNYIGDSAVLRQHIHGYRNMMMKIRSKLGKSNSERMYLSRVDESEFITVTNKYINSLFAKLKDSEEETIIVLDQAVPPTNISAVSRYFKNIKVIIVDRDPRDIYANLVKNKVLIGAELCEKDSVEKYVLWHSILRRNIQKEIDREENKDRVLMIKFEDIVCNYSHTINKIITFLGGKQVHKERYKYFNPDSSRAQRNVGLWKSYHDQSIMDKIYNNLERYCYDHQSI